MEIVLGVLIAVVNCALFYEVYRYGYRTGFKEALDCADEIVREIRRKHGQQELGNS